MYQEVPSGIVYQEDTHGFLQLHYGANTDMLDLLSHDIGFVRATSAEHRHLHRIVQDFKYLKVYITLFLRSGFIRMLLDLLGGTVIVYLFLECRPFNVLDKAACFMEGWYPGIILIGLYIQKTLIIK